MTWKSYIDYEISWNWGPESIPVPTKIQRNNHVKTQSQSRFWWNNTDVDKDHFVYALSQWETTLQCNVASHWLGAYTKWSLLIDIVTPTLKQNVIFAKFSSLGALEVVKMKTFSAASGENPTKMMAFQFQWNKNSVNTWLLAGTTKPRYPHCSSCLGTNAISYVYMVAFCTCLKGVIDLATHQCGYHSQTKYWNICFN